MQKAGERTRQQEKEEEREHVSVTAYSKFDLT